MPSARCGTSSIPPAPGAAVTRSNSSSMTGSSVVPARWASANCPKTTSAGFQPHDLGIDLGKLLAQPLGAISQYHPTLHHPHQNIRHEQPSPHLSTESTRRHRLGRAIPAKRPRGRRSPAADHVTDLHEHPTPAAHQTP